jgi:hypothetical protein
MKITLSLLCLSILMLTSCSSEPTVQRYFVEKSENKDFIALDVAPGFIDTKGLKLSAEEQKAVKSLHHINILAFKANQKNVPVYKKELDDVKKLIKSDHYDELMTFNSGGMGASLNTRGEGEHIEEFVLLANNEKTGFGVVRVTGNDMTPANIMTIMGLIQKANLNMEQFKPLKDMFPKEKQLID